MKVVKLLVCWNLPPGAVLTAQTHYLSQPAPVHPKARAGPNLTLWRGVTLRPPEMSDLAPPTALKELTGEGEVAQPSL